jgi:hypothetical protein
LPGGLSITGVFAQVRESAAGAVQRVTLVEASALSFKDANVSAQPAVTGKVAKMNRKLDGGGWISLAGDIADPHSLVGRHILIHNANERDAAYPILSAEKDGALTRVYCGPISFVRGYAGPTTRIRGVSLPASYDKGFLYDFEEGATFRVPLHKTWAP